MKLLYILNFARRANNFSFASMKAAQELGFQFHLAGCFSYESEHERREDEQRLGITIHQIPFLRNPFHPGNRKAYRALVALMQAERFDLVHTNTPIGGALGRLAAKKVGLSPVIYQAHGFHFYKGAPFINWLVFYPIEKALARITDAIITINQEDRDLAKKRLRPRNHGPHLTLPGVGIRTQDYGKTPEVRAPKRRELAIPEDAFLLLSVGELNPNKNQAVVLSAIANQPQVHYAVAGVGPTQQALQEKAAELSITDRVHLLGYRSDVKELYQAADLFCHPSHREGLSVAVMEAMASGLPVLCSDIRGNRDLVQQGQGGTLVNPRDAKGFEAALVAYQQHQDTLKAQGQFNRAFVKRFDQEEVIRQTRAIYQQMMQKHQEDHS